MTPSVMRSIQFMIKRYVLRQTFLEVDTGFFDIRMKARVDDMHGRHLYKRRAHDGKLTATLIERLVFEPGDVAFDIGANIGWYSMILDRLAPAGVDVFAFEPDPFNFGLLTDNIALNRAAKVTAVQLAVAQVAEGRTLYRYRSANRGRHSLLPLFDGEAVEVRTTTLDDFWEERALGHRIPRFIKLDIEGYEYFALQGGSNVLARCPNLLMEYSPDLLRRAGIEPRSLLDLLTSTGMEPALGARVSSERVGPVDLDRVVDEDVQCNILWGRA
jgi:FkbM family methyltransferase